MNLLSSFIVGNLEDKTGLLVYPELIKKFGHQALTWVNYPFNSFIINGITNEPVFWAVYLLLASKLDSVLVYNLIVFGSVLLIFFTSYIFFKGFGFSRFLSFLLGLTITFSPLVYYQAGNHPTMLQAWMVILYIHFLTKAEKAKHFVLLGLFMTFIALTNNYFGYFSVLIALSFLVSKEIVCRFLLTKYITKKVLANYFLMFVTFGLLTISLLFPYVKTNYLVDDEAQLTTYSKANFSWKVDPETTTQTLLDSKRKLEDFFTFTSRPWYYVLPSPRNPFIGGITTKTVAFLQDEWGYFLAQNHFPAEHSASYFGWTNLIFAAIGFSVVRRKLVALKASDKPDLEDHKLVTLSVLGFTALILILLTMPPYFTLNSVKIYMPSYVLFKTFTMFRVLSRLGFFTTLFLLLFTGYGYQHMLQRLGTRLVKNSKVLAFILIPFTAISLLEFYVPVRILNVTTPPEVYTYIRDQTPQDSVLAVYPFTKTTSALFYITHFQRRFINPAGFNRPEYGFDSNKFTDKLITCTGVLEARNLGATHILYFDLDEIDSQRAKMQSFLEKPNILTLDQSFDDSTLYQLKPDGECFSAN